MSTDKTAPTEAVPVAQRRRRPSVGGTYALKLDAPQRPGWVRRWVNGDPMRIRHMEELGYSVVSEAAGEGSKRTEGLGTRITRHAGRGEEGKPFQAVLMETPDDLYAEGTAEKESGRQAFEESIRRGARTEDTPDGAYIPSRNSITQSG
jgi:hypothetical protein